MRSVRRGTGTVTLVRDAGGTPAVLDYAGAPGGGTDGVDTEIADVAATRIAKAAVHRTAPRHGGLGAVLTAEAA